MTHKFKINDKVTHKFYGTTGTIKSLTHTQDKLHPAYSIKLEDGNTTRWAEIRIVEEIKTTTYDSTVDLNDVIIPGDKIRILTQKEFEQFTSFDSDGNPYTRTTWNTSGKMKKLMGKTLTVTHAEGNSLCAENWYWQSDSFKHIIKSPEIPSNTTIITPTTITTKEISFDRKSDFTEYIKAGDKIRILTEEEFNTLAKTNSHNTTTLGLTNWNSDGDMSPLKGKIITVERVSTKEVYADGWYWKFDSFVQLKETVYIEESSENHYILPKNTIWQYTGKETTSYIKGNYYLQKEDSNYPFSVIDEIGNENNGYNTDYGLTLIKIVPSIKVTSYHPDKYYMCIDSSVNTANVVKGKTYKGKYLIFKKFPIKYFVEIQTEDIEEEENSENPYVFPENTVWQYIGDQKGAYAKNGYYLQRKNSEYPLSVLDEVGNKDNGYSSTAWSNRIKIVPSIKVIIFDRDKYYMCIKTDESKEHIVRGRAYNGGHIMFNELPTENFLEIQTNLIEEEEIEIEIEEIKSLTNTIKEEIKLMFPHPVLLEGPVGSGKSTIFIELAEELNLDYYASVMSDATTASEFKGYRNVVNGEYVGTEFRKAVEFGGIYVLEELNATTSNMPIIFNSIENGYFVFADQLVAVHPEFRLCATMNTITNAKDFGGRRPLDKSVKDRFHTVIVQADLNTRFPKEIIQLQTEINYYLKGEGSTVEVGPRDMTRYLHLVAKGMPKIEACIKTMHIQEGKMRQKVEALIKKQIKEG